MESVEELVESFVEVGDLLYSPELEPDPARSDWSAHGERVTELFDAYEDLLEILDGVASELEDEILEALTAKACHLGLGVYAVLTVSGQSGKALPLLAAINDRAASTPAADLLSAAGRDSDSAVELSRLRHQLANDRVTARPALKRLAAKTSEPAIAEVAKAIFNAPKPIEKLPPLGRWNGFGTGVYGSRDVDPYDGSEIKTLCLSALWVPVFPLSAYRVIDHRDGSLTFMSKNPLSGLARAYQKIFALAVVGLIAFFAIDGYLSSPNRLAGKALDAADQARVAGETDDAIAQYDAVVRDYAHRADRDKIDRAATAATRLRLGKMPETVTPADRTRITELVRVVGDYPRNVRDGAARELTGALMTWSTQLESAGHRDVAIELLDGSVDLLPGVDGRLRELRTALAADLAPRRPVDALDTLMALGANDKAGELIASLADHPSLVREAAPLIERWLASHGDHPIKAALDEARAEADNPIRAAALSGDKREPIEKALEARPKDHELVVALAELDRAAGDPKAAIDRLSALAEPGWLTGAAQQTLAIAHADLGDLATADALLDELLRYRLAGFRRASAGYRKAAEGFRQKLILRAESGGAPPEVNAVLRGTDQGAAQAKFEEWASSEMGSDAHLAALRAEYQRHGYVVGASLALGTIKLQRANRVDGAARDELLADAERAFLAISDDAVGLPSYHLGLGQVYHRLGKSDEGEAELKGLLGRGDFQIEMAVATAYRELGMTSRSKEVAEGVYNRAPSPTKEQAAAQLSFIVDDLDEQEQWLEKADKKQPEVRVQLDNVRATRASRDGDDKTAAALYRKVAAHYGKNAEHSSAAANNAAIAHRGIYRSTGDRAALARARAGLEAALRLEPANALVVGNLAEHTSFEGWLQVLAKELPTERLRLDSDDIASLINELGHDSALVKSGATNPLVRRSTDLTGQEIVLAPNRQSAWNRAIRSAALRDDKAALAKLVDQLGRVKLDHAAKAAARAAWLAGDSDAVLTAQLERSVERLRAMLAAARGSARATAAAKLLLGNALAALGWQKNSVAELSEGLALLVAASQAWPELGDTSTSVAISLALLRAAKANPEIEALRAANWREHSGRTLVLEHLVDGDKAGLEKALGADPAIAAAARRLTSREVKPGLSRWVIGELTGNRALRERGAEILRDPLLVLVARASVLFSPFDKSSAFELTLFENPGRLDR